MKFLYLVLNRLAQYFRKNKLIFILFFLGGIINTLVFCYLYGNMLPAVRNRNSHEIQYRQYTVYAEADPFNNTISSLIRSGLFESIAIGHREISSADNDVQTARTDFFSVLSGDVPSVRVKGKITVPCKNEIIVPSEYSASIGDTLTFFGQDFIVVGQHTGDEFYISNEMYNKFIGKTDTIYSVSFEHYSHGSDPAEELLNNTFQGSIIRTPTLFDLTDRNNSFSQLIMICLCYLVSSLSFAFLFSYMLESGMDENIVSIISGASGLTISVMVFWEGALLTTLSAIVGLVIHFLLSPVFFNKINMSSDIRYTMPDYIIIFALLFAMSVLIILIFSRKYARLSPVQARHKQ